MITPHRLHCGLPIAISLAALCIHETTSLRAQPAASELMIVLDPAVPSEPPTDQPARVLETRPVTVASTGPASNSSGLQGRLAVRLMPDGTIGRIRFETPRPAKATMAEIERDLRQWRFAPPTRSGKAIETWLPLVYSSAPAPVPGADAPPRSLFAVLPDYPYELWRPWARTGSAAPVVSLPTDTAPKPGGSADGSIPPPIGDNKGTAPAHGRTVLGKAGSGPNMNSHAPWFSGHVTLLVDVDEQGLPTGAEVVRSTASCFESSAVAAVMHWRFLPAVSGGRPVAARIIVPVSSPGTIENPPPLFFKPADKSAPGWDEPPRMRHLDLPVYPQDLLAADITGRASASVELDASGAITRVELLEATKPEFGHALLASIARCQHDPARRAGRRVPATIVRTAVFEIGLWHRKPAAGETPALLLAPTTSFTTVTEAALDAPLRRLSGRPPAFADATGPADPASATIEMVVSSAGEVLAPRIAEASSPAAGYAAVQAVATWRFAPPTSRGATVPVTTFARFGTH